MKQLAQSWKLMALATLFCFFQVITWAQDNTSGSGGTTTTTTSTSSNTSESVGVTASENWYASPWVWIVGAALFILLLVALLGGGRKSTASTTTHHSTTSTGTASGDRITVDKTVRRDTDTDV